MSPPEHLRSELERLRDRGLPFTAAWPVATSAALRDENVHVAYFWRGVFREQRHVWATSYSRAPWPASQRPGLEPVGIRDDSVTAMPVRVHVAA